MAERTQAIYLIHGCNAGAASNHAYMGNLLLQSLALACCGVARLKLKLTVAVVDEIADRSTSLDGVANFEMFQMLFRNRPAKRNESVHYGKVKLSPLRNDLRHFSLGVNLDQQFKAA